MRLVILATIASLATGTSKYIGCYFGSWATYQKGLGKFDVENIDPFLCTHLVYGFAGLGSNNKIKILDPWNDLCKDYGLCAYNRFTGLKKINPNLVTTLSVGGWNEGSTKYSHMAADPAKRKSFIESSIELVKAHNFDGLDLDWEYPTMRGGQWDDKANYLTLLQELGKALHAEGLTLTIAVSAGQGTIDQAYPDGAAIAAAVDYVHVMGFDLHGSWEKVTGHQSQLYKQPGDQTNFNVAFAMNYWIKKGVPAKQLVMGTPLYGDCWTLNDMDKHGLGAPANQPSKEGPWSESSGQLAYNEICHINKTTPWTVVHQHPLHEPYAYNQGFSKAWCGYEEPRSLLEKAAFANSLDLAGMFCWSIDQDDFHNECGDGKFALMKAINDGLNGGTYTTHAPYTIPSGQTTKPRTKFTGTTTQGPTTTEGPTTSAHPTPNPSIHCKHVGINSDNNDCTVFYQCEQNGSSYKGFKIPCPPGELFDASSSMCTYKATVCKEGGGVCPNDC